MTDDRESEKTSAEAEAAEESFADLATSAGEAADSDGVKMGNAKSVLAS